MYCRIIGPKVTPILHIWLILSEKSVNFLTLFWLLKKESGRGLIWAVSEFRFYGFNFSPCAGANCIAAYFTPAYWVIKPFTSITLFYPLFFPRLLPGWLAAGCFIGTAACPGNTKEIFCAQLSNL